MVWDSIAGNGFLRFTANSIPNKGEMIDGAPVHLGLPRSSSSVMAELEIVKLAGPITRRLIRVFSTERRNLNQQESGIECRSRGEASATSSTTSPNPAL